MEEVPGRPGAVPPLAEYPPASVRASLPPQEWQACLDFWLLSIEFRLRLQDQDFSKFTHSNVSGIQFLRSYFENHPSATGLPADSKEVQLHRRAYLLFKRLMLGTNIARDWHPKLLIDHVLLADQTFHHVLDWPRMLSALRQREQSPFSVGFESWKSAMQASFEAVREKIGLPDNLRQMNSLIQVLPEAGLALMTGSDYLESMITAYSRNDSPYQYSEAFRQALTEHLYRGLRSLMVDQTRNISNLLDHLYLLRTEADTSKKSTSTDQRTLLSSLLCTTAFLRHLARDNSIMDTKRGRGQVDSLSAFRDDTKHLHPPPSIRKRRALKGKGRAKHEGDFHVHKATQISQVHDLFPEFSNVYVLRLLEYFEDDVERVIAALLEPHSLPEDLREPDDNAREAVEYINPHRDLAPRSTPPLAAERRNVFDDDAFDRLRISSKQLHKGRKKISIDEASTKDEHARSKAAIMAALAAFDSDDDERDDTYDVADVGGSVDRTVDTDLRPQGERLLEQNPHDETLFRAWKSTTEMFARDSKTRITPGRQDLKRQTGMSDEQIEGWAIMLSRDRGLQDRLQKRYSDVAVASRGQRALDQTRWQQESSRDASADETEGLGEGQARDGRRMGEAQIRGSRNWGRARGGNASGPASDPATQAARRRKEQGRGRGGGHNRREGRARKMGRGMAATGG